MTNVVWHLCSNRWNSAVTEYALRSAQSLKMRGWHSVLSGLPESPCERRAKEYGVNGPSFQFRILDLPELRAFSKSIKPSVIICYGGPETFLSRFLGVPVIRFRGQDSDLSAELSSLGLKLNLGFTSAILTPAEIVRERFIKALPRKKIEKVCLGLDSSVFFPTPLFRRKPILLIVGRLDPIKGHAEFFKLFKELLDLKPSPPPFLEIVGQRSNLLPEELHALAKGLGLLRGEDYEIVDERVPDLPDRMARATLGIVPSLGSEVIGRVAEEFLLTGTPVLVNDVGSLNELLAEEEFGAILSLNSLEIWLKRSQSETFEDRLDRAEKAKEHFSLETMGSKLENLIWNAR